jgi:microcystin degradation protein MlrC
MADFDECGMSVFGYGSDQGTVANAVATLRGAVADAEKDFALELHTPDEAVSRARARGEPGKPVVIADTQDNPGAGGNGDTTGMLAALVRQRATEATLGLLIDGESAKRAHDVGLGFASGFKLGGRSNIPGDSPFEGEFTVERLGEGKFTCTGPMFKGFRMDLGPMALLRSKAAPGVRVALGIEKMPGGRQGNVPSPRRGAGARAHAGAEEFSAFPGRLRTHRARGAGGKITGPGAGRSLGISVEEAAQGPAPAAAGPAFKG